LEKELSINKEDDLCEVCYTNSLSIKESETTF